MPRGTGASNGIRTTAPTAKTADIAAAATSVERREQVIPARAGGPDLAGLLLALQAVKDMDRSQERARLDPADDATTATIIAVMDVLRGPADAPLFPKLTLSGSNG